MLHVLGSQRSQWMHTSIPSRESALAFHTPNKTGHTKRPKTRNSRLIILPALEAMGILEEGWQEKRDYDVQDSVQPDGRPRTPSKLYFPLAPVV